MPRPCMHLIARLTLTCLTILIASAATSCTAPADRPKVEHIIILGIDGLSAEAARQPSNLHLRYLMENGAYTLRARAVLPTVSKPNWASLLMGAPPTHHGVLTNPWRPDGQEIEPIVKGPDGLFPTIFWVLRQQRPDSTSAVFHEWPPIRDIVEPYIANAVQQAEPSDQVMLRALDYIKQRRPTLTYIALDLVDFAGHHCGWNTPEYFQAVEEADSYVGLTLATLREADLHRSTILFIVSDHGGKDGSHGGLSRGEIEVPWMLIGPTVRAGHEIAAPVHLYDTAATIAHILRLTPPEQWIARPVLEALDEKSPMPSQRRSSP